MNGNLFGLTLICLFVVLIVTLLRHKRILVLTRVQESRGTKIAALCLLAIPGLILLGRWLAR